MEKCALCKRTIDLSLPDEAAAELNLLVGSLMENLGPAKIRRENLPNHGDFWTTINGLLFVPYLERGSGHWICHETKQSSWWNPFARENNESSQISDDDLDNGENGGEILQNRPGAWFAKWSEIHRIQQTSRGVRIELQQRNELFVKPRFDINDLKSRWQSLQSQRAPVSAK